MGFMKGFPYKNGNIICLKPCIQHIRYPELVLTKICKYTCTYTKTYVTPTHNFFIDTSALKYLKHTVHSAMLSNVAPMESY